MSCCTVSKGVSLCNFLSWWRRWELNPRPQRHKKRCALPLLSYAPTMSYRATRMMPDRDIYLLPHYFKNLVDVERRIQHENLGSCHHRMGKEIPLVVKCRHPQAACRDGVKKRSRRSAWSLQGGYVYAEDCCKFSDSLNRAIAEAQLSLQYSLQRKYIPSSQ